jgi:prepilin-type N-terminal cleavage/methylation domain-containing protein
MKPRTGYSLAEVLIVLAVLAVMMTVATWLIWELVDAQKAVRRGVIEPRTLARLAETFREDVHTAVTLRIETEKDTGATTGSPNRAQDAPTPAHHDVQSHCTLLDAQRHTIASYHLKPGQVIRTQPGPDGTIYETFRLADGARPSIAQAETDSPEHLAMVTLLVEPREKAAPKRPPCYDALRAEARLGRDAWLSRAMRSPVRNEPAKSDVTGKPDKITEPDKVIETDGPEKAVEMNEREEPEEGTERKGVADA